MRKNSNIQVGKATLLGVLSLVLVFSLAFATELFSMVSYAQSQGKVTANSANIRAKADAGSTVVGSAKKDAEVTINGKTTDASGNTWYQVFVDANTLGFIRSDLVKITDGTTPATLSGTTNTTTTTTTTNQNTNNNETPANVKKVNPISATITGSQNVRVRDNASTTSNILKTAQNGMALTVIGTTTGTDNKEWYQVKFAVDGSEITGFIRSDYVKLSGELTDYVEPEAPAETEGDKPAEENKEEVLSKDWETQLQGEDWYLIDNKTPGQYKIKDMFSAVETNSTLYSQEKESNKNLKIVVIVLVIVIIALAAAVAYLIFKVKDMADLIYFAEAERALLGKKTADRPQSKSQAKLPQGGAKTANGVQGQKAQGQKAQGQKVQGQKPQNQRVAQGAQPQKITQAPQGQRPVQAVPGNRPVQPAQGQRPTQGNATQKPMQGAPGVRNGQPAQRPQGQPAQRPQGQPAQRPQGQPQGVRPGATAARPNQGAQRPVANNQNPNWKSKNFMADEDEFEFEFLNWDGEEEE